jgi:hypothetical protein
MYKDLPPQEVLLELFSYDPETGDIKNKKTNHTYKPHTSGSNYVTVCINKTPYAAHRVIWKMVNGQMPTDMTIDHIDLDKSNNRLSNLRIANRYQQGYNRAPYTNTVTGFRGVTYDKDRREYKARIRVEKKRLILGWFKNVEDARQAYIEASKKYHGEFGRY